MATRAKLLREKTGDERYRAKSNLRSPQPKTHAHHRTRRPHLWHLDRPRLVRDLPLPLGNPHYIPGEARLERRRRRSPPTSPSASG
ncbi:hypothetical protein BJX64DRAFT_265365 [Aspergillus heterothallicus]